MMMSNLTTQEYSSPNYALAAVLFAVIVIGAIGNSLVILVVLMRKSQDSYSNYYFCVLNLAVCDLVVLVSSIETPYRYWSPAGPFLIRSTFACKLWSPVIHLAFTSGAYFMILIAVLRHRAVVHPLKPAVSRRKLRIIAGMIHVLVLICLTPGIYLIEYTKENGCVKYPSHSVFHVAYFLFLVAIQYFIPLALISVLYFRLSCELLKEFKRLDSMGLRRNSSVRTEDGKMQSCRLTYRRNLRAYLIGFIVVVSFGTSASVKKLESVLVVLNVVEFSAYRHGWLFVLFLTGTSAVNPFIYCLLDKNFLVTFRRYFSNMAAARHSQKSSSCVRKLPAGTRV